MTCSDCKLPLSSPNHTETFDNYNRIVLALFQLAAELRPIVASRIEGEFRASIESGVKALSLWFPAIQMGTIVNPVEKFPILPNGWQDKAGVWWLVKNPRFGTFYVRSSELGQCWNKRDLSAKKKPYLEDAKKRGLLHGEFENFMKTATATITQELETEKGYATTIPYLGGLPSPTSKLFDNEFICNIWAHLVRPQFDTGKIKWTNCDMTRWGQGDTYGVWEMAKVYLGNLGDMGLELKTVADFSLDVLLNLMLYNHALSGLCKKPDLLKKAMGVRHRISGHSAKCQVSLCRVNKDIDKLLEVLNALLPLSPVKADMLSLRNGGSLKNFSTELAEAKAEQDKLRQACCNAKQDAHQRTMKNLKRAFDSVSSDTSISEEEKARRTQIIQAVQDGKHKIAKKIKNYFEPQKRERMLPQDLTQVENLIDMSMSMSSQDQSLPDPNPILCQHTKVRGLLDYVIVELAAQGGQGSVYEAYVNMTDQSNGVMREKFCLKTQRKSEGLSAGIAREAEVYFALPESPHLAILNDVATHPSGTPILISEWADSTLEKWLEEQKVTTADNIDLLVQILRGLQSLHQNGLVHQDLKPANILLFDYGLLCAKLTDFGCARGFTLCGSLAGVGTKVYMGPEQLFGKEVSTSFDMWSFGLICALTFRDSREKAKFYLEEQARLLAVMGDQPDFVVPEMRKSALDLCAFFPPSPIRGALAQCFSSSPPSATDFEKTLIANYGCFPQIVPSTRHFQFASDFRKAFAPKERLSRFFSLVHNDKQRATKVLCSFISSQGNINVTEPAALVSWVLAHPEWLQADLKYCATLYDLLKLAPQVADGGNLALLLQDIWEQLGPTTWQKLCSRDLGVNSERYAPFSLCCTDGLCTVVDAMLQKRSVLASTTEDGGWNPLAMACGNGHLHVVLVLLQNIPQPVWTRLDKGATALHVAAIDGHAEIVRYLLTNFWEALADQRDYQQKNAFHIACEFGRVEVVKAFLEVSKEEKYFLAVDCCERNGFHLASLMNKSAIVGLLLETQFRDSFLYSRCCQMMTPLHLACSTGAEDVVRLLLKDKSTRRKLLGVKADRGLNPLDVGCLQFAQSHGNEAMISRVLILAEAISAAFALNLCVSFRPLLKKPLAWLETRIQELHIRAHYCANCKAWETVHQEVLKKCTWCQKEFYCSLECQRLRWNHHKTVCKRS